MKKLSILSLIILFGLAAVQLGMQSRKDIQSEPISSELLNFTIDTIVTGVSSPWGMAWLPNGDMLFTEKTGSIRIVKNGKLHPDPIKGAPEVKAKGQGGMLDIELHPNYADNGWIYISFSSPAKKGEEGEGANTEFIRAKLKGHELVEHQSILKALPNYTKNHHYAGRIEFDKEGYLYLSVGDRGGRDENQTIKNYRGKVFRVHDDGRVPKDNPFVNEKGAVTATYSYGHRNPQGLAMHPVTGDIWEHEHGPQGGDEVNIIKKGSNYGWPTITYGINYDNTIITDEYQREGMEQPIIYWKPSIAPCGMDFVESDKYGKWKGNLLVGSLKFRYIKRCEVQDNRIIHQETLLENIGRVRAIRQAPDGFIYVAVEGPGMILRITPADA